GTNNPSRQSTAVDLGVVDDLRAGIAAPEGWAYTTLPGAAAVLHVPGDFAAYVPASLDADGRWRTVPGNDLTVPGTASTVHHTGDGWGAIGTTEADTAYDRQNNSVEGWAHTLALVAFDPATVASVTVNTAPSSV